MRKIKEVLRLKALGLHQHQIARSCAIGQSSVHHYLKRAAAAGISWPLAEEIDDAELERRLFPAPLAPFQRRTLPPLDFAAIHRELVSHKHVTLQLLWEEYHQNHPEGHRYSWFCQLYRDWANKQNVVLRQHHRAGEKLFVDHAGETLALTNRETGEVTPAYLFVAVLGASNYTYAEATLHRDLPNWIGSHVRAFEFFGACPEIVVPDNWKTEVTRACRYEPDLNMLLATSSQSTEITAGRWWPDEDGHALRRTVSRGTPGGVPGSEQEAEEAAVERGAQADTAEPQGADPSSRNPPPARGETGRIFVVFSEYLSYFPSFIPFSIVKLEGEPAKKAEKIFQNHCNYNIIDRGG
jgi:transposase